MALLLLHGPWPPAVDVGVVCQASNASRSQWIHVQSETSNKNLQVNNKEDLDRKIDYHSKVTSHLAFLIFFSLSLSLPPTLLLSPDQRVLNLMSAVPYKDIAKENHKIMPCQLQM